MVGVEDRMNKVRRLPVARTVETVPNDPHQEFMFDVCEGVPPARQKRLILRARSREVGFIDQATADILLDALGIQEA